MLAILRFSRVIIHLTISKNRQATRYTYVNYVCLLPFYNFSSKISFVLLPKIIVHLMIQNSIFFKIGCNLEHENGEPSDNSDFTKWLEIFNVRVDTGQIASWNKSMFLQTTSLFIISPSSTPSNEINIFQLKRKTANDQLLWKVSRSLQPSRLNVRVRWSRFP